jgi:hypothetical protein
VDNDPDDGAVLLDLIELLLNLLLAQVVRPLGRGLGEGLLFRLGPALRHAMEQIPGQSSLHDITSGLKEPGQRALMTQGSAESLKI